MSEIQEAMQVEDIYLLLKFDHSKMERILAYTESQENCCGGYQAVKLNYLVKLILGVFVTLSASQVCAGILL